MAWYSGGFSSRAVSGQGHWSESLDTLFLMGLIVPTPTRRSHGKLGSQGSRAQEERPGHCPTERGRSQDDSSAPGNWGADLP